VGHTAYTLAMKKHARTKRKPTKRTIAQKAKRRRSRRRPVMRHSREEWFLGSFLVCGLMEAKRNQVESRRSSATIRPGDNCHPAVLGFEP
jgi:hypothetical protein